MLRSIVTWSRRIGRILIDYEGTLDIDRDGAWGKDGVVDA